MKKTTIAIAVMVLMVLLVNTNDAIAQNTTLPVLKWQKSFGGTGIDWLESIVQATDGGYVFGGYSDSGISGNKTSPGFGREDYWVVKVDADGNKIWEQSFGGTESDYLYSLQQTVDGGYILGGYSESGISGNKTSVNYGGQDYWVIKLDSDGNKTWERSFGGSGNDYLSQLQQTADGGYVLGGVSRHSSFIVKIDAEGNKVWDKAFVSGDQLNSLHQTADGGYILGASSMSGISGDKTSINYGWDDYWVVKIDADGNKTWDKTYGGSGRDLVHSIRQTREGGYIVGGRSTSDISGNKTSPNYGEEDYWVVKLDQDGNKVWDQSFGGFRSEWLGELEQTADDGYILGGTSSSWTSDDKTSTYYGNRDYWIVKLDTSGNKVWEQSFGGYEFDELYGLKQTSDGGYILGGYSESPISGNKTTAGFGREDYWIIKLDLVEPFADVPIPEQETYSCQITRQDGKDNLVVVTHGWIPKKSGQTSPPDPDWVDSMANRIRANIERQGLNNWQVESFKWTEKAWMEWSDVLLDVVLSNGEKEGGNLGDCLTNQGWSHIHLIGHSAGAAVIQAATLIIKSANVNTIVHTTFLDPYVGFTYDGRKKYGEKADWADSYVAWDLETYDGLIQRTFSKVKHAYNVDVTWLDPDKVPLGRYRSIAGGGSEECFETVASHDWPHIFYVNTVPLVPLGGQPGSEGFGFPLSKEGGNWDFALANYSTYTDPVRELGAQDPPCPLGQDLSSPVYPPWMMDFKQAPIVTSLTGLIENNGSSLILGATSSPQQLPSPKRRELVASEELFSTPAWISTVLSATNKINSVSFDAEFSSANGSEGVLSVYLDTNIVGTIDERVVVPGLQRYTYLFPTVAVGATHTLGFRLDSFTAKTSSILVTNVTLDFVGIPDPFTLSFKGRDAEGFALLELTGPPGFNYIVEVSADLIDWQTMAVLININGTVPFMDRSSNSTAKFYRAVGY